MNKNEIKQKYEFTKRDYFWIVILLIVASGCDYFWKISQQLRPDFIANILTFLSITNGFYITSLAMFAGTDFIKNLYQIQSEDPRYTLLHKLLAVFSFPFHIWIWTIWYLLICHIIIAQHIKDDMITPYWFEWIILLCIFPVIIINFYTIIKSFRIFKAFVKKSWE